MKFHHLKSVLILSLLFVAAVTVTADDPEDEDDAVVEDAKPEEPNIPTEEKPVYKAPQASGNVYFADAFESEEHYKKRWVVSSSKKDGTDESISKYDGVWKIEEPSDNPLKGDLGLVLKSKAKHHAVSAKLTRPFQFKDAPFIAQYEVKFQSGQECGGAYIKLLTDDSKLSLDNFNDKTGYTIMFGPDKCGNDAKLHFIFRHKNPKNGKFEEKHAKKPSGAFDTVFSDKRTHLFTLVVRPDNTFEMYVDQEMVNSGSLLEDFEPAVNPPAEIVDPKDKKPEDWDEREKIPDPDATKPDDWDESEPEMIADESATKPSGWLDDEKELIADPNAEKPADWDDDMDGEFEAPMINNPLCESAPGCGEWKRPQIKNPKYKGKWRPDMIDNPAYKGKWSPRKIPNPDFFEDNEPFKMTAISAVGLELWSMSDDILFDNFIVTDDKEVADKWAKDSFELKKAQELAGSGSAKSVVQAVKDMTNERPWLWAVFVLVVVLPIVLLIGYCCMGGSSKGIFQRLFAAADERKWLYAVYAVVILLPVAILSVFLCPNRGLGVKPDDIAQHKKTDEATPEDVAPEEEEEEEEDQVDAGAAGDAADERKKSSKAALEAQEQDAQESEKKPSKAALEAEEEEAGEADAEEEETKPGLRKSPRKRKTRKD